MLHIRYLHHLIINMLHKFLIWLFIRATLVFYLFLFQNSRPGSILE